MLIYRCTIRRVDGRGAGAIIASHDCSVLIGAPRYAMCTSISYASLQISLHSILRITTPPFDTHSSHPFNPPLLSPPFSPPPAQTTQHPQSSCVCNFIAPLSTVHPSCLPVHYRSSVSGNHTTPSPVVGHPAIYGLLICHVLQHRPDSSLSFVSSFNRALMNGSLPRIMPWLFPPMPHNPPLSMSSGASQRSL